MAKKSTVNSCQKGKTGERAAAKFLRRIGFPDAIRSEQHCGKGGYGDVSCPETLPSVFLEVKYGCSRASLDDGTEGLRAACEKARDDADGNPWCVLWKPKGSSIWRMTVQVWFHSGAELETWTTGDTGTIKRWLQETQHLCDNALERNADD